MALTSDEAALVDVAPGFFYREMASSLASTTDPGNDRSRGDDMCELKEWRRPGRVLEAVGDGGSDEGPV